MSGTATRSSSMRPVGADRGTVGLPKPVPLERYPEGDPVV